MLIVGRVRMKKMGLAAAEEGINRERKIIARAGR